MSDITVEILKSIRADIAALDRKVTGVDRKVDAVDRKVDAIDRKVDAVDRKVDGVERRLGQRIDQLAVAVEHTNERLGSMVSVLRLSVGRQDDLDDRIRRLEAEASGGAGS